jgi:hypothetical protein
MLSRLAPRAPSADWSIQCPPLSPTTERSPAAAVAPRRRDPGRQPHTAFRLESPPRPARRQRHPQRRRIAARTRGPRPEIQREPSSAHRRLGPLRWRPRRPGQPIRRPEPGPNRPWDTHSDGFEATAPLLPRIPRSRRDPPARQQAATKRLQRGTGQAGLHPSCARPVTQGERGAPFSEGTGPHAIRSLREIARLS